jgi:hypothetical protein
MRSDHEIRADLATEEGQGGLRRLSPIGRLTADVPDLLLEVERLEGDLTVAVHEATTARARADALRAAVAAVRELCNDPGGADSWTHTFKGQPAIFVSDVVEALDHTVPGDGSITLAPNPWGSAATWADYNWAGLAADRRDAGDKLAAFVFDAIAAALAGAAPTCEHGKTGPHRQSYYDHMQGEQLTSPCPGGAAPEGDRAPQVEATQLAAELMALARTWLADGSALEADELLAVLAKRMPLPPHADAAPVAAVVQATPEPTKTAAELLRQIAAADPQAHARALGRAYGVGPATTEQDTQR